MMLFACQEEKTVIHADENTLEEISYDAENTLSCNEALSFETTGSSIFVRGVAYQSSDYARSGNSVV